MALWPTEIMETVLVVEDNPLVLRFLSLCLTQAGHKVLSAAGPEEARLVEAEYAEEIHLLLSDLIMLNTCGPHLAAALTARRPEMRVILISGNPDDPRALNYNGHFLRKPFLPSDLLRKVNEVLGCDARGSASSGGNKIRSAGC